MIPADVRAQIGAAPLRPIIRVGDDGTVIEPVHAPGAAVTLDMRLETSPARTLTVPAAVERPLAALFIQAANQYGGNGWDGYGKNDRWVPVRIGYALPDGTEYTEDMGRFLFDGFSREGRDVTGTFTTGETACMDRDDYDAAWKSANPVFPTGFRANMSVAEFAQWVVSSTWPGAQWNPLEWGAAPAPTVQQVDPPTYTPTTADGWGVGYGTDRWDALMGVLQAAQLRLDPSDTGTWRLVRTARAAGTPVATFVVGAGGDTLDYSQSVDRAGVVNTFIVTHEWADAAGNPQTIRGTAGSVNSSLVHSRVKSEKRTEPTTQQRADQYAASRLSAANSLLNQWTITAPMMPWLRPDDTVRITSTTPQTYSAFDQTLDDYGRIASISFDVTHGTMTLTTRKVAK